MGRRSSTSGLMMRPKATTTPSSAPDADHVLDLVADGQAESKAAALTGLGRGRLRGGRAACRAGDHEGDVVTGLDEGLKRHRGRLGRAQESEAQDLAPDRLGPPAQLAHGFLALVLVEHG